MSDAIGPVDPTPADAPASSSPRPARPFAARVAVMGKVGIRMMFHDRSKFAGTLFGVVFSVVLANQQAGVLLGLLAKNTMFVDNAGADVWVVPKSTETLQPGKPVSVSALYRARTAPGAAWAEPLLFGGAIVSLPGGGSEPISLIGAHGPSRRGGPWNMVVGTSDALGKPDAIIFEDSEREKLGGLNPGSVREVNGHRTVASGFTWGLLPFGPSYAFVDYDLARTLLKTPSDQTSFVLVGAARGVSPGALREEIRRRVPDQLALTTDEFRAKILRYLLTTTGIGVTFGTSAVFGLLVGLVIVSLSMFSAVVDNVREFGTLKAMGNTDGDLALLLLVQAAVYAAIGSTFGLGIVSSLAAVVRSPKLAIVLPWQFYPATFAVMAALCAVASSLALLRLRDIEPGLVFR